jgi:hypothetical protein
MGSTMSRRDQAFGWLVMVAAWLAVGSTAFAQEGADGSGAAAAPFVDEVAPAAEEPAPVIEEAPAAPAAPAASSASPPVRAPSAVGGRSGDINYDMRLRELEDRVDELKEDIFRTKTRLFTLREQILQEGIGGSRLVVVHRDRLSATYTTVRAQYFLDGNLIWAAAEGDDALRERSRVFAGSALTGPHLLSVEYVLRGNDFGIFSYMSGYEFTLRSSHAFQVEEGQTVELVVEPFERGGANQPIDERPDVRFVVDDYATTEDTVALEGGAD